MYTTNDNVYTIKLRTSITGLFLVFFWVIFWQWGGCNGRTERFCGGMGWILGLGCPLNCWVTCGWGLRGTNFLLNVGCFCFVWLSLAVHFVFLHSRPFICAQAAFVLNLLQLQKWLDVFRGCGVAEGFLVSQAGILCRVDSLAFLADITYIHCRLSSTAVVNWVDQRFKTVNGFTILGVLSYIGFRIGKLDAYILDGLLWNLQQWQWCPKGHGVIL